VLDMSKIESGQLDLDIEDISVSAAALSALRLIRHQADRKGVPIRVELPESEVILRSDARALKQILINLLSNAVKFTDAGGRVIIEVRIAPGGMLSIEVHDTGIGIDAKDLGRVFEAFEQADHGIAKMHGGSGLGLAISRRLAHALGAELSLESELGVGTSASLRFPASLVVIPKKAHQSPAR